MFGAALLLNSCVMAEIDEGLPNPTGKVQITLEVESFDGMAEAQTRGMENTRPVDGESNVNSLDLLFFESGTKPQDQKFVGKGSVGLPGPTEQKPDGGTTMNVDGFDFPGDFGTAAYTVLALGNVSDASFLDKSFGDWVRDNFTENETTLAYVLDNFSGLLPQAGIAPNMLPMVGRYDKPADETKIHLLMTRAVSRLDVTNTLKEKTGHTLVSVSVWNSFPETSMWGGGFIDYSAATKRIRRHYGVNPQQVLAPGADPDDANPAMESSEKIRGGLYAFENQVKEPTRKDELTTCLIVGLLNPDGVTGIEYFRANIVEPTNSQNLRRNHVYNLIIEDFENRNNTKGATSEEIAYMDDSNKLIVRVGDWSEDSNGLVVSDQNSTLSVSTKTVNMGGSAPNDDNPNGTGSVAEISVHTFSTLASPAPLQVHSQTYRPALNSAGQPSITAELEGNTLVIRATAFDAGQDARSGVIVLSYAGLEIAVSVSQAGKHNDYLIVTEPDGGILPYLPYAGQY
jgi:hypothetical protein